MKAYDIMKIGMKHALLVSVDVRILEPWLFFLQVDVAVAIVIL
jgi:hypothetical protein